jgi:hypothetical protein
MVVRMRSVSLFRALLLTFSALAGVAFGSGKSRSAEIQSESPKVPGSSALLSPNDVAVLFHLPNVKTKTGTLQEQVKDWLIPAEPDQGDSILPRGSIRTLSPTLSGLD